MTRYVMLFLLAVPLLTGCRSLPSRCDEVLPVLMLAAEPAFTGDVSLESDDAAVRCMAMREELMSDVSPYSHDVETDRWDTFVAIRFNDEMEDSAVYSAYLQGRQWLFNLAEETSRLGRFGDFGLPTVIYGGPEPEGDPRRDLLGTMRLLTHALGDDAQRHWIQGRRELAIRRVGTILRLAHQMQLKPDFADVDPLVAMAIAGVGLDRLNAMVETGEASDEERALMLEMLAMMEGDDPLGVYCERVRTINSYQRWLETQLETEEGTLELWTLIGRFEVVDEIVSQFFRAALNPSETEQETPGFDLDEADVIQRIMDELEGIDIGTLREAYREYEPLTKIALDQLRSGSPDPAVLREVRESVDDDATRVSDILGLSTLEHMNRNYQMKLDQRDELLSKLR